MTEKEKAALGLLYNNNYDKELIEERLDCQTMCHEYNQLPPREMGKRQQLIRQILGDIGDGFQIEQPFHCDFGYNIHIGKNFYANYNFVVLDEAPVTIGEYVFIAPDCGLYTAGHPINASKRNEGLEYAKPITIGNHVWLGGGVKVMPGLTIGNNVVIGSGSIVTKDIPDGVVAAGNPCKIIRKIDEKDREM